MKKIEESLESISESLLKIVAHLNTSAKTPTVRRSLRPGISGSQTRAGMVESAVFRMVSENIKDTSLSEVWSRVSNEPMGTGDAVIIGKYLRRAGYRLYRESKADESGRRRERFML